MNKTPQALSCAPTKGLRYRGGASTARRPTPSH